MSSRGPVLTVTITGDTKGLSRATGAAASDVQGFGRKISGFAVGAGAAVTTMAISAIPQLVNFGGELIGLGKKSELYAKKADTVFGSAAGDVRSWADNVNESLGLSDEAVLGLAGSMGDLLKPMGFTEAQTAGMTTKMLDLAGALSAWSGGQYDAAGVSEILTKAMLGERDGLKALGISISDADVKARLAAKGQDKLTGAALEQAEALATQELIFEKSTDAQKAWNDGSMDSVKQSNELSATIADVKESLAKWLLPAVQAVTRWIAEELVPGVKNLIAEFKEKWPQIQQAMQPTIEWIKRSIASLVEFAQKFWAMFGETIIKRVRIAFDMVREYLGGAKDYIQGVFKFFSSLIRGEWGNAWKGALQALRGVGKMLRAVLKGLLRSILEILRFALEQLGKLWLASWRKLIEFSKKAITGIVNFVKSIPGRIADTILHLWDAYRAGLTAAAEWARDRISDIVAFVKGIPGRIASTIAGLWTKFKDGVDRAKQFAGEKITEIVLFVTGIPGRIANTVATLWDKFIDGVGVAKDWVGTCFDTIVGFVTGMPGRIASAASGMWNGISDAFRSAINWIIGKWNGLQFSLPGFSAFGVDIGGFTIGTPDIPYLAEGGIVKRRPGGVLALIGEGNYDEAVIPLKPGMGTPSSSGGNTYINHWPAAVNPTTVAAAQRRYDRINATSRAA